MKVLFFFDEKSDIAKVYTRAKELSQGKIILCPLTTNINLVNALREKLGTITQLEIVITDFLGIFNDIGYSLREGFINFISDFPERKIKNTNLKSYFKYPFKDFSIWWFSLIAEKNTLKTKSFHNLAKFMAILKIIENEGGNEIWVDFSSRELAGAIKENFKSNTFKIHNLNPAKSNNLYLIFITIATNLFFFTVRLIKRIALAKLNIKRKRYRIGQIKKSKFLLVTYFPIGGKNSFNNSKFINKFYGPLQASLRNKFADQHSWLAMVINEEGFDFSKSVKLANKINEWGENLFICEEWLGFVDLLRILVDYLYFSFRFLLIQPQIKKGFRYKNKLIIWPLFANDWLSSFCGNALIEALYFYRIFTNVFRALEQDTKVLYIAEMQAWEKVLLCARNRAKSIKIIALQHATVPLLWLSYFNTPSELNNKSIIGSMPKPDFLGCSGMVTNRLFGECGWPRDRLFFCGALRYQHLKGVINNCDEKKKEDKILVALSILPGESRELLYYLYQAFKGESGYKILIKEHPHAPITAILKDLDVEFDAELFDFVNTPIPELMKNSKAVITNVSSAAVEAIAYRLPVLSPLLSSYVNMNPLRGLCGLVRFIKTPMELREAIVAHLKHFQFLDYDTCDNFIRDYFTFFNNDSEFLEKIEALN